MPNESTKMKKFTTTRQINKIAEDVTAQDLAMNRPFAMAQLDTQVRNDSTTQNLGQYRVEQEVTFKTDTDSKTPLTVVTYTRTITWIEQIFLLRKMAALKFSTIENAIHNLRQMSKQHICPKDEFFEPLADKLNQIRNEHAKMLETLTKIARHYQQPEEMRETSEDEYGLDFSEALEMAYENIQGEAAAACRGIEVIK